MIELVKGLDKYEVDVCALQEISWQKRCWNRIGPFLLKAKIILKIKRGEKTKKSELQEWDTGKLN